MYILFTGAPGSKWSSVAQNIYLSPDIDRSDSTGDRAYHNGAVKHQGAYFDPGMEYGNAQSEWDKPFSGTGHRIIKSHTFAHQLDELKTLRFPIVLVYRNDVECLDWWRQAGGFEITYPNYQYYENYDMMWQHIQNQNRDIMQFIKDNRDRIVSCSDNVDLCRTLNITFPDTKGRIHNYEHKDIKVYVYR